MDRQEGTVIYAALLPSPSETHTDQFGGDPVFYSFHPILVGSEISKDEMIQTEDDYGKECDLSFVFVFAVKPSPCKMISLSGLPSTFAANKSYCTHHPPRQCP